MLTHSCMLNGMVMNYFLSFQEEGEENFVMTALFTAVEEGNLAGIQELIEQADHLDITQCNRVCTRDGISVRL